MSFTDVMYGPLGQVNNNFQANLAGNAAAMQSQQGYYGQQAALDAQNQAALANAYGPLGFGGATAANAYAGAAAGRDTGGFGGYGSANADPFTPVSSYNDAAGMSGQGATGTNWNGFIPSPSGDGGTWGPVSNGDPPASPQLGGGVPNAAYPGSSGNNALANALWQGASPQAPALQQPQPQAVDWNSWFTGLASQPANAGGGAGGYWQGNASGDGSTWVPAGGATPTSGGAFNGGSIYGGQPFPSIQNVLGYTPDQFLGAGSGGGGQPQQMGSLFNQGGASWIGAGGTQNPYNPFGQINSGQLGGQDAFMGYPTQTGDPGQGGIGSDARYDPYGWTLAQSSPYAQPSNVPYSPSANLGYNPGMSNYFANPGMQTSNVDTSPGAVNAATGQMQDLLGWYNQLMFDPNFRQVGSDVPQLPGSVSNTLRNGDYFPGGEAAWSRGGG